MRAHAKQNHMTVVCTPGPSASEIYNLRSTEPIHRSSAPPRLPPCSHSPSVCTVIYGHLLCLLCYSSLLVTNMEPFVRPRNRLRVLGEQHVKYVLCSNTW